MQLVLVAHRSGASFEIRNVSIVVGNDESTLKLTRVAGIDAEVRAQLHRTAHAFRDIYERTVAEYSTVERCIEVITIRHYRTEILLHEVGMVLYGVADRAEYDAFLGKML